MAVALRRKLLRNQRAYNALPPVYAMGSRGVPFRVAYRIARQETGPGV